MPSRRRPKGLPSQPAQPLSDAARFAQSLRDSEEADRRARQAATDRKADAERLKTEAAEQAERHNRARVAHHRAVEMVKEATRTGKGAAAADLAWREAKAELLEIETGQRPAWAAKPAEPEPEPDVSTTDEAVPEAEIADSD